MNETNDGGAAFPMVGHEIYGNGGIAPISTCGMSLRDWFAGQALAGLIGTMEANNDRIVHECYAVADALIEERGKRDGK